MPFEEVPHTADWSIHVWAPDLPGLFTDAARGMMALSGICLALTPRDTRTLEFAASDLESLLVSFLTELLWIQEEAHLAFDQFFVEIDGYRLSAHFEGAPILSIDKAIKAVTYHNLHIRQTSLGYEVEIVFDV